MMKKKINFGAEILLSAFLLVFGVITFSCNVNVNDGGSDEEIISLSAPVISPASGDYSEGRKTVSITNKNNVGEIFYTLDSTEPTAESPRYTKEFTVIGSKTIKAIIISGNSKSAITTAKLNLNAGKTQSQLGVVSGKLALATNLTDSVKKQLADSTIYIFSDDLPGVVKKSSIGGEFYFDGLDTSKSYSFYFTNKEPGVSYSRTATVTDDDGNPIVSTVITDVTPEEGAGLNLSEVELKPAGKISGTVKKYDVTGSEESDCSGITVYVPGTSYSAITDKTGNFTISGVPQGLLTIRASYAGYSSAEKENILLSGNSEDVPETVIDEPFELYFGKGIVKGSVVLSDVTDTSGFSGIDLVLVDSTGSYTYSASTSKNGSYSIVGDNLYIDVRKDNSFYCIGSYMYLYYQNSDSDVDSHYISLSRAPAADSEWHYVSFVYGKTYVAQYIDGILTSYEDGLSLTLYNNDNKLCMDSKYIDAVDEIRISNAARSAAEIKAYYDCAKEFLQ